MVEAPVALVTGASRGIGKATALRFAAAGFDVAITARTEREGEGRTEPSSVREPEPVVAVPGSLETTAAAIEQHGRRALPITMDLLDVDSVVAAPRRVLSEWGRLDVLVNNAIVQGSATMDRVLDLTAESMTRLVTGNYVNQVVLIQQAVPHMIERGSGRVINIVSGSARVDPQKPAGAGGWGIAYSASKAAFGRVAGGVNAEFGPAVLAFNVDPGNVITEKRRALRPEDPFEAAYGAASPDAAGAVAVWLATSADATDLLGRWIDAPKLSADRDLVAEPASTDG